MDYYKYLQKKTSWWYDCMRYIGKSKTVRGNRKLQYKSLKKQAKTRLKKEISRALDQYHGGA